MNTAEIITHPNNFT